MKSDLSSFSAALRKNSREDEHVKAEAQGLEPQNRKIASGKFQI